MKILNLTQHPAIPVQVEAGVYEPVDKAAVQAALTFDSIPSLDEMIASAQTLAKIATAHGAEYAMIGGAPFFMAPLERALRDVGVKPLYAFSVRAVEESIQPDGSSKKTQIFRHLGFVGLYPGRK